MADGYTAEDSISSCESPLYTMINVSRSIARRFEGCEIGELWITPDTW